MSLPSKNHKCHCYELIYGVTIYLNIAHDSKHVCYAIFFVKFTNFRKNILVLIPKRLQTIYAQVFTKRSICKVL